MASVKAILKENYNYLLRTKPCFYGQEWALEIAWIVYTLQSILFPLWSLILNDDVSPTTLSYVSYVLSSAAAFVILVLMVTHKRKTVKSATFDKTIKGLIQSIAICHVVLKLILFDSSVNQKTFSFVGVVEFIFVAFHLNEKFTSKVPGCLIIWSFIIYGLVANSIRSSSFRVSIAHYCVAAALLALSTLKPLVDSVQTGSLLRKLTLVDQKRIWEDHLEGLPDLILIIDQNKKLIYGNKAYTDLCNNEGFPPESLKILTRVSKQRFVEDDQELKDWLKEKIQNTPDDGMNTVKTMELYRTMQSQTTHRLTWNQTFGTSMQSEHSSRRSTRRKSKYDTYALNIDLERLVKILSRNLDEYNKIIKGKVLILYGKLAAYGHDHWRSFEIKIKVSKEGESKVLFLLLTETSHRDKVNKYQEINSFKNQLLGSFSHELRTPLNSNLNFLQAALTHPGITKQAREKVIDPALKSSQLLTYLVSDILDYSQLALKNLTLNFSKQGLNQELEDAIKIFKTQSHEKQTKVFLKIDNTVPLEIKTDFPRLKRVLVNLLKVSLVNTYQGSITVEVIGHPHCNDVFKISVKDTEITYTEEQKEQIRNILKSNLMKGRKAGGTEDLSQNYLSLQLAATIACLLSPPKYGGIRFESLQKGSLYYFYIEDVDEREDHRDVNISEQGDDDYEFSRKPTQHASGVQKQFSRLVTRQLNHGDDMNFESMENKPLVGQNGFTDPDIQKKIEISMKDLELGEDPGNKHQYPHQAPATILQGVLRKDEKYNNDNMSDYDDELLTNKKCECQVALVVDDDPFNVLSLGLLLQSLGLKYEEAYNGKLAVEKIMQKKKCSKNCNLYSIIFLDCNMPVQDGYTTAIQLKEKMKTPAGDENDDNEIEERTLPYIPIVACTAYIMDFQATKCKEIGMDEYLTKPIEKKQLFRILKQYNILKSHQRYE